MKLRGLGERQVNLSNLFWSDRNDVLAAGLAHVFDDAAGHPEFDDAERPEALDELARQVPGVHRLPGEQIVDHADDGVRVLQVFGRAVRVVFDRLLGRSLLLLQHLDPQGVGGQREFGTTLLQRHG